MPTMNSKELKHLHSLMIKKFRSGKNEYILEGKKVLYEALASNQKIEKVFFTNSFLEKNENFLHELHKSGIPVFSIEDKTFSKFSGLKTPEGILAVVKKPVSNFRVENLENENLIIYLDKITDPGNLGTIIRTADWFGVNTVLLSNDCVELYNPKTIRSTMGSNFHLNIYENCDEHSLVELKKKGFKIIATTLTGKKIEKKLFNEKLVLIFSSESHGLSEGLRKLIDDEITIPKFGKAESLNVSSAAASILALIKIS